MCGTCASNAVNRVTRSQRRLQGELVCACGAISLRDGKEIEALSGPEFALSRIR
jgi:hypothetical protein